MKGVLSSLRLVRFPPRSSSENLRQLNPNDHKSGWHSTSHTTQLLKSGCMFVSKKNCWKKQQMSVVAETPVFFAITKFVKKKHLYILKLSTFPCHLSRAATFPTCNFPSFMVITSKITCGVVEVGFVGVIIVDQKIAKYYIIEPYWDWNIWWYLNIFVILLMFRNILWFIGFHI